MTDDEFLDKTLECLRLNLTSIQHIANALERHRDEVGERPSTTDAEFDAFLRDHPELTDDAA